MDDLVSNGKFVAALFYDDGSDGDGSKKTMKALESVAKEAEDFG